MTKKLVVLPQSDVDYVQGIADREKSPRAQKGDFGKALSKIIKKYKEDG
jgi:hypothetical protein